LWRASTTPSRSRFRQIVFVKALLFAVLLTLPAMNSYRFSPVLYGGGSDRGHTLPPAERFGIVHGANDVTRTSVRSETCVRTPDAAGSRRRRGRMIHQSPLSHQRIRTPDSAQDRTA
jgi:hypothetical protein